MIGEIIPREPGTAWRERRHDLGGRILIEGFRPVHCDCFQRGSKRREPHDVARGRRSPFHEKMARCARIGAQRLFRKGPVIGDTRGYGKPVFSIANRGAQGAVEPETAMTSKHGRPRLDGSRYCDPMGRMGIDGAYALVPKDVGARRGGGAAGTVVTPNRRSGLRNEAKTIASDAGHMGLDDRKRSRRRDRGIGRCAARLEAIDRHLARQRMRGSRHAGAGKYRRATWTMELPSDCTAYVT